MANDKIGIVVIGPSGVGKSVLAEVLDVDGGLDPHRVRQHPRDDEDSFYLSSDAREWLSREVESEEGAFRGREPYSMPFASGDVPSHIRVYPTFATFPCRKDRQVLFIPDDRDYDRLKIEIFAPVLVALLYDLAGVRSSELGRLLADRTFVVLFLNPWGTKVEDVDVSAASNPERDEGSRLIELQLERDGNEVPNPKQRERVVNVREELPAWQRLQAEAKAGPDGGRPVVVFVDALRWEFTEGRFKPDRLKEEGISRVALLVKLRDRLESIAEDQIEDEDVLGAFLGCLKSVDSIRP